MRLPSSIAFESGLRKTSPAPSPRTYPSALASKAKHFPVGDSMLALLNPTDECGVISALTPPANAESHWPDQIASQAWATATNADEQAVSTATLGPVKSNW